VERLKLGFRLIADPELGQVKALGMLHPGGGKGGKDVARPGTYVVGRDGRVAWFSASTTMRERPDPRDVIAAVKAAVAQK
jgi:peroxiredoxin